jgi:glycogen phosphorylase
LETPLSTAEEAISTERRQEHRRARPLVAYFSMEIGLENDVPTYSGGLGILAGDTLRAGADLGLPMVAVTLVHRSGYFRQTISAEGVQTEEPAVWSPETVLEPVEVRAQIELEGQPVIVRAWRYTVKGDSGSVPVYLLDTDLEENSPPYRAITHQLYGGDLHMRLLQEAVLGIGGVAILDANGHDVTTYHMNEGHSALLGLALIEKMDQPLEDAIKSVRERCVFTTHTPIPAGHDKFPLEMVRQVLGERLAGLVGSVTTPADGTLNMTHLALDLSRYVNGVAMRHRDVSAEMFPNYLISAITNGVHAETWTAQPIRELFDKYIPDWREENFSLRYAIAIDHGEMRAAHDAAKHSLIELVRERTNVQLDPARFTIGFARRATPYKRGDMLFSDLDRLRALAKRHGGFRSSFPAKPTRTISAARTSSSAFTKPQRSSAKRSASSTCRTTTWLPHHASLPV